MSNPFAEGMGNEKLASISYFDTSETSSKCQKHSVCAVIVLYQPNLNTLHLVLESVCDQVSGLVLIQNDCVPEVSTFLLREITGKCLEIMIFREMENVGLAAAQNRGIKWAQHAGFTDILLLDQDSVPNRDMVARLTTALDKITNSSNSLAIIGPQYIDPRTGHHSYFVRFSWFGFRHIKCKGRCAVIPVDFLISSGALIPIELFKEVGYMDELLYIDHVDTEWFLRVRAKGFQVYGLCEVHMFHNLGESVYRIWLGRWRYLANHPQIRHYYIFRNSVILYKRHYAPLVWVIGDLRRLLCRFFFYSIVTPPRWQNMIMMLRGIRDGIQS